MEPRKLLLQLEDGLEVESVILPLTGRTGRQRRTLCVSSQVGCAMGCTFCETAQMGLMRHLTASEIILQWHVARHHLGEEITNIVFMGMGEPLDNVESVIQAIRVLVDRRGPSLRGLPDRCFDRRDESMESNGSRNLLTNRTSAGCGSPCRSTLPMMRSATRSCR